MHYVRLYHDQVCEELHILDVAAERGGEIGAVVAKTISTAESRDAILIAPRWFVCLLEGLWQPRTASDVRFHGRANFTAPK